MYFTASREGMIWPSLAWTWVSLYRSPEPSPTRTALNSGRLSRRFPLIEFWLRRIALFFSLCPWMQRNGITANCSAYGPEGIKTYYALKTRTNSQTVDEDEEDIHLETGSNLCYNTQITTTENEDGNQTIHLDFQFRSDAPSCTWEEYSANLTYRILGCVAETSVVRKFADFNTQTIENFYGPCCIWTS